MKKNLLFLVISLFLLIPASIIWGQNVSVSGNVYEKNTVKNSFKTPHGTITAILPDDMAADDVISGTVLYEPDGNNQRKKRNNLEQLIKYTLFLESGTPIRANVNADTPTDWISEGNRYLGRFTVTLPLRDNQTSLHLLLKDAGNKIVGESKLPLMDKSFLMRPGWFDIGDVESGAITRIIQTDKTIYLSGENAVIFLPPVLAKIYMENTLVSSWASFKGRQESEPLRIDLTPVAASPRRMVIQIPSHVYGPGEIILEDENKKVIASQKIHVLKLEASCPKTSLMKNEETVLNVNVKGVKDCPADFLRLKLDNVIGSSVQLGQSNHEEIVIETVNLKYSKIKWDYKAQDEKEKKAKPDIGWENYEANAFSLKRSVTALQSGKFTINIGLTYPSSVYNDPFRQQLDVLKTPEQFNNWQNALKNDLVQNFSGEGKHIKEGIISFKAVSSPTELDEAKSRISNIINWPRIGQEVVVAYLECTLEAGKAAVENAITNAGNAPANIEVIESALKYSEHQADIAEDKTLKDAVINAKDDLSKLQKEINDVSQQLQILNNIQKVFNDASKAAVNNMRTSEAGNIVSRIIVWDGELTAPEFIDLELTVMPNNEFQIKMSRISSSFVSWMNSFINGQPVKKSGSVSHVKIDNQPTSTLDFKNALITEISFPKMDAAAKDITMIGFKFKAEEIKYTAASEKVKAPDTKQGKQWMPSNFKIELGDFDCKEIKKIDGFTIKQQIKEYQTGSARDYKIKIEPGKIEYPNLTFYLPEVDIKPWIEWYNNFEKNNSGEDKEGSIQYLDKNSKQVFALTFKKITPVSVKHVSDGQYAVSVKPAAAKLGYEIDPGKIFNINTGTYIANEIAGNPCKPEGATTFTWLYIEKPCRVEMATTRASNTDPDAEDILNDIQDLLGEVSEDGADLAEKLAKTFSITNSFAVWMRVVRDWESYKAEYVCRNGVWQHGEMTLVNSGVKEIVGWQLYRGMGGEDTWTDKDDMSWIRRNLPESISSVCNKAIH